MEKYLYQHITNKKELLKDLAKIHVFGFFLNHVILGFALVLFFEAPFNPSLAILVIFPFFLHTISASIALSDLHERFKSRMLPKIFLSSGPLIGALIAISLHFSIRIYYAVFSFILGVLFYIVVRDMIPRNRRGSPLYFFLGLVVMYATLYVARMV